MKQSALTKENEKYIKIDRPVKTSTLNTNNEHHIVTSIKRISTNPNEINKIFCNTSKATPEELHKQLHLATDEIINIFYDMELAILSEGAIPLIMGEKLNAFKAIISLCKIQLCQPGLNEISFPEIFTEEYSLLLKRTDKAIKVIKTRINKLKAFEEGKLLKNVLEKNLFTLNMLHMHYINALRLSGTK